MELLVNEADFRLAMSEFANLVTLSKSGIIRLKKDVILYKKTYLKRLEERKIRRGFQIFDEESNISKVVIDEQLDWWMKKLQKFLKDVEFFGRTTSLKIFTLYINYLHILPSPIELEDRELKLPIYNITFPEDKTSRERNDCFAKMKKCRKHCKMCH